MEPGLNQRDRAKSAASYIKSFVKTTNILRFLGCQGPSQRTRTHARRTASRTHRARPHRAAASSSAADPRPHARTTAHDDEKMLRAHMSTNPETPMAGYGGTGQSPRQRGRCLVPPMRARPTQPHGRRHKALPQPCALTTGRGGAQRPGGRELAGTGFIFKKVTWLHGDPSSILCSAAE